MRKDSTTLIRKYLDEIKRLETELALYRRRSKQLQEELREANDALQKDEEIFEEKMIEMKDINHEGRIFWILTRCGKAIFWHMSGGMQHFCRER